MKIAGFLMMLAGWGIVVTAIVLLRSEAPKTAFVAAGLSVELLGFVLEARAHIPARGPRHNA